MNVYFNENFWGCRKGRADRVPGKEIRTEKEFIWDGRMWRIPSFYVCEEGVVVDFCVRIPKEEIEAFLKKWRPKIEELTEEELPGVEQENPFSVDMPKEVRINGRKAEGFGGCGVSWIPPCLRDESEAQSANDIEEEMMEVYACDCRDGWKFVRMSVPWPEGVSAPVRSLTVRLKKAPVYDPGPHFRTDLGEEKKQVEFIHPRTGVKHTLTVQYMEQTGIPGTDLSELRSMKIRLQRIPTQLLTMFYTVEPKLSQGELRIYDCTGADPAVPEKGSAAAGISVIGGADGPTAVFFAGKTGAKDSRSEWSSACSSVRYEPVKTVEWRMEFWTESNEHMEIELL